MKLNLLLVFTLIIIILIVLYYINKVSPIYEDFTATELITINQIITEGQDSIMNTTLTDSILKNDTSIINIMSNNTSSKNSSESQITQIRNALSGVNSSRFDQICRLGYLKILGSILNIYNKSKDINDILGLNIKQNIDALYNMKLPYSQIANDVWGKGDKSFYKCIQKSDINYCIQTRPYDWYLINVIWPRNEIDIRWNEIRNNLNNNFNTNKTLYPVISNRYYDTKLRELFEALRVQSTTSETLDADVTTQLQYIIIQGYVLAMMDICKAITNNNYSIYYYINYNENDNPPGPLYLNSKHINALSNGIETNIMALRALTADNSQTSTSLPL